MSGPMFNPGEPLPCLSPSNDKAEMALLGALLTNNLGVGWVCGYLREEHFTDPVYRHIYASIVRRVLAGQLADVVTLKAELDHSGVLDDLGGAACLRQLVAPAPIIDVGEYACCIRDAWVQRQLIDIDERIALLGERVVHESFGERSADLTGDDIVERLTSELRVQLDTLHRLANMLERIRRPNKALHSAATSTG